MVALLNTDISLSGSFPARSENVVHPVGSQSGLPFGLRRQVFYLVSVLVFVTALVVTVQVSRGAAQELPNDSASVHAPEPGQVLESTHIVQPGETLWGIAVDLAPNEDPRPLVDALVKENGSAAIYVGQKLAIPADLAR